MIRTSILVNAVGTDEADKLGQSLPPKVWTPGSILASRIQAYYRDIDRGGTIVLLFSSEEITCRMPYEEFDKAYHRECLSFWN